MAGVLVIIEGVLECREEGAELADPVAWRWMSRSERVLMKNSALRKKTHRRKDKRFLLINAMRQSSVMTLLKDQRSEAKQEKIIGNLCDKLK